MIKIQRKSWRVNRMNVEMRIIRIWIPIKIQEKNFKCFFIYEMWFHKIRTHIGNKITYSEKHNVHMKIPTRYILYLGPVCSKSFSPFRFPFFYFLSLSSSFYFWSCAVDSVHTSDSLMRQYKPHFCSFIFIGFVSFWLGSRFFDIHLRKMESVSATI